MLFEISKRHRRFIFAKTRLDNNSFSIVAAEVTRLQFGGRLNSQWHFGPRYLGCCILQRCKPAFENLCQWGTREKNFHKKSFFLESRAARVDSKCAKADEARCFRRSSLEEKISQSKFRISLPMLVIRSYVLEP